MASSRSSKPPIPDLLNESDALAVLVGGRKEARLANVEVGEIDPNPYNPRQTVDVTELVESMRTHGFIGALDGRRVGERVQLAYGARRLVAARQAGIGRIPVYLHDWDDQTMLVLSLVENVQREDLSPWEAASTIHRMQKELGWSQDEIARRTGKNRSWVRDMLSLANAPADLVELVKERPDSSRHVRYLTQVQDEAARQKLATAVREREVTAQQLYRAVQAVEAGASAQEALQAARQPATSSVAAEPTRTAEAPTAGGPVVSAPSAMPPEPSAPSVPTSARGATDVAAVLEQLTQRLARLTQVDITRSLEKDAAAVRQRLAALQEQVDRLRAQLPAE